MQAAHASLDTGHGPAMGQATQAVAASGNDNPADAVGFHKAAQKEHQKQALNCMTKNDANGAQKHTFAANCHGAACIHHAAENKGMKVSNESTSKSNPQRRTNVFGTVEKAKKFLIANCSCDEEKAALNELSPKDIFKLALNAKAEGSNADTDGPDDTEQAGGEEEDKESEHDPDMFEEKTKKESKVKGDKKIVGNMQEWLATAPPQATEIWNNALRIHINEKKNLATRLTNNIMNPDQRKRMFKDFMSDKYTVNSLKDLIACMPTFNRQQSNDIDEGLLPMFLGSNAGDAVNNSDATTVKAEEDSLPLPTMNYGEIVKEQRTGGKKTG
jgi:hypothetical protein